MTDKPITGAVSHNVREIEELRADRELTAEYFKAAIEALSNPAGRAAGLAALGTIVRLLAEEGDAKPLNHIDQAWIALAQHRVGEIRSGTAQTFDTQQVLDDARRMLRRIGNHQKKCSQEPSGSGP